MSKVILVTGGAGFIGSSLCDRLLEEGHSIVCLDNFNTYYKPEIKESNIKNALKNENYRLIRGDILDKEILDRVFSEYTIGKVIHLAAVAGVRPSILTPDKYIDIDIKGTVNLLEKGKEYDIEQFIFASSSSVYGINTEIPFSEKHKVDLQISPYASAKRAAELFCSTYHHLYGIPITILRFFTVYGPRQRPDMAIYKFTRLMSRGETIPMFGNGESERDYTHISDVVNGIVASLTKNYDFEVFNIGNSKMIKLRELIDLIADSLGVTPRIKQLPIQRGDIQITCADIAKAKKMLGYYPSITIEYGIEEFIRWYKDKNEDIHTNS